MAATTELTRTQASGKVHHNMTFSTPPNEPSRFAIGNRVTASQAPGECGTIVGIEKEDITGRLFQISWDKSGVGVLHETALVPCSTA
jgi:hypothetical protein